MCGSLAFVVLFGLWRGRGSNSVNKYLLAGRSMPWYAMALSIMATQASAVTFISTTGQSYVDGMRFVQFYFGLPLAMVIISMTAVPIFRRAKVYTAYEYLEQRFDARTRLLVSVIFLVQRGLALGITLYAPAVVLSVILGWPDYATTLVVGVIALLYTTMGGVKAVAWTDFQQMLVMTAGLVAALVAAVYLLPGDVSFLDAVTLAGAAGRLNAVTLKLDWNDRYNLWSGLIGGAFLALSYFGCDQSQVQRYLTGRSIAESRLSLLFNAMAKVPMQFFILFIGAMVFVFYIYEKPPILFQPAELEKIQANQPLEQRYDTAFESRKAAAGRLLEARHDRDAGRWRKGMKEYREAQGELDSARRQAVGLAENDTNYIFLTFVTQHLPAGLVGLLMAVILGASMASISGEMNSLATVSVIDIYKRHFRRAAPDHHYLNVSRAATVFWGCYAVATANYAKRLGSLVEAVNILGSFFYGGMLGVFVLAFFFPRVRARGAFYGVLAGEAAIFAAYFFTNIAFLWYNVIGCLVVVGTGVLISRLEGAGPQQGDCNKGRATDDGTGQAR
jgi:SSS family transporter